MDDLELLNSESTDLNQSNVEETDDEFKKKLKEIIEKLEGGDRSIREEQLQEWKKLMCYFDGIQDIYWDSIAKDWRRVTDREDANDDSKEPLNDKIVNTYRAHGESIIAALSTSLPYVRFFPEDADNPDDILTAKAYSKISEMIQLHNSANLLFVKALYILFNQGFVACYNYHHIDKKYGTVKVPFIETQVETVETPICPQCGSVVEGEVCETCGVPPIMDSYDQEYGVEKEKEEPKGRECLEIYGPVHVKIPDYVSHVKDTPYLILETEQHYTVMRDMFPGFYDKIHPSDNSNPTERWARTTKAQSDSELVTYKRIWLRPFAYATLEKELYEELKASYPNGILIEQVNDIITSYEPSDLDEHWTISRNPLSDKIHANPVGRIIAPIQELENELIDLTISTIRHGIPETFYDPEFLDGKSYSQVANEPGLMFPAKTPPGKALDSAFTQIKPATLSQEVDIFAQRLESKGQFASGDFPSIFGGAMTGGGKTLGEYEASRNQAMQRLSLTWKVLNAWWPEVMERAVRSFHKNIRFDEHFVRKQGNSFVNVWIRQSETSGKVGLIQSETSDQFPITTQQKRALILQLIEMKDQQILQALYHPENVHLIASILGFSDFYVPGEDDRNKQLIEIGQLLQSPPMPDMMTGQMSPSVPINPELDNHEYHVEILRVWLNSEVGIDAQMTNPEGYANVMAHFQMHNMYLQQQMAMQQMQQQQNGETAELGGDTGSEAPPAVEEPPNETAGMVQ